MLLLSVATHARAVNSSRPYTAHMVSRLRWAQLIARRFAKHIARTASHVQSSMSATVYSLISPWSQPIFSSSRGPGLNKAPFYLLVELEMSTRVQHGRSGAGDDLREIHSARLWCQGLLSQERQQRAINSHISSVHTPLPTKWLIIKELEEWKTSYK